MQRICETLSKEGFRVTIIGRALPNSTAITPTDYHQVRLKCFFNKGKLFYFEYNTRLLWFLLFFDADIYSAVDLDTIAPVYWASFIKGRKRYFDAHEYFEEVPEVVNRRITKTIWQIIAQVYIPMFHRCYTVGNTLAEVFSKKYHHHFSVIKNVPSYISEENNSEGKYLLYQGALNEGRGLEQLIEAMHHIDMPLKIAGEGDLSASLRLLVDEKKLQQKIEFLGFVKPGNLAALTQNAFLGLNLLENKGKSYYYSLANKFFDYIQAEVPSINMHFPEYAAINKQYEVSILLNELSAPEIVNVVNKLLSDKNLYLHLRQQCRQAKKEYNWQQEEKKLLQLYIAL
jgi:glycosyltransferase involved in cell wall biosynthesis